MNDQAAIPAEFIHELEQLAGTFPVGISTQPERLHEKWCVH